jgi:MFS family permease
MRVPPTTRPAPSNLRVSLLLGGMTALTVVGSSAVAVALPQLSAELGLTVGASAWVLAAFALTFALGTAVFGRLTDVAGLRLPFVIGIALLVAGSFVAASAATFPALVAGRLLQGAGSGSVPVLSVAILQVLVPRERRARALGGLTAVVTIVSGSGPFIGGALAQLGGWRLVLAVPALGLALAVPIVRLAASEPVAQGRLDTRGLVLVTVSVGGLLLLLQGANTGLTAAGTAVVAGSSVCAAALLALHVRARPGGFLPSAVLSNGHLIRGALAGATLLAAYVSTLFALPNILSAGHGWSPLAIGTAMLPAAAAGAAASRLAGVVAARRPRSVFVVGAALSSVTGLALAGAFPGHPWLLVTGFALVAAGFGAGQVFLIDAVPRLVEPEVRGAALGVFNLLFFLGSAVGAAALGGLVDVLGVPAAMIVMAAAPALGAGLAATVDLEGG